MPTNFTEIGSNPTVVFCDENGNTFDAIDLIEGDISIGPLAALFSPSDRSRFKSHSPEKVIFSGNATICIWKDGSKTIARCHDGDQFDRATGVIVCAIKKWMPGGSYWLSVMDEMRRLDTKVDDRVSNKQESVNLDEAPDVIDDYEASPYDLKTRPTDWYHRGLAYDEDFKLECVQRVENGESMTNVARTAGISISTISHWCSDFGVKSSHHAGRKPRRA